MKKALFSLTTALFLLFVVFTIPLISAFNFDNVKKYEPEVKLYGKIKIVNAFGLGSDIAEYKIDYNTDKCLSKCYTVGTAILHQDMKLFSDVRFYNVQGQEKNLLKHGMYIEKSRIVTKDVTDYTEVCNTINSTQVCREQVTGSHQVTEIEYYWQEYNKEVLPSGSYKWKVEGTKGFKDRIDFVPFAEDLKFSEWVWWDSSYKYCRNITFSFPTNPNYRFNEPVALNITINSTDNALVWILFTGANSTQYSVYYNSLKDMRIVNASCDVATASAQKIEVIENSTEMIYLDRLFIWYDNYFNGTNGTANTAWDSAAVFDSSKRHGNNPFSLRVSDSGAGTTSNHNLNTTYQNVYWAGVLYDDGHASGSIEDYFFIRDNPVTTFSLQGIQLGDWTNYRYSESGSILSYASPRSNGWRPFKAFITSGGTYTWQGPYPGSTGYVNLDGLYRISFNQYLHSGYASDIFVSIYNITAYENVTTYSVGSPITNAIAPVITLNKPTSSQSFSTNNITFNCSVYADSNAINLTLVIDSVANYTIYNTSTAQNIYLEINRNIPEGTHDYYCFGYDANSLIGTTSSRSFTVDTTPPNVRITYPANQTYNLGLVNSTTRPINVTVNISDLNLQSCEYRFVKSEDIFGVDPNTIFSCSQTNISFDLLDLPHSYYFYVRANDSVGNVNSTSRTAYFYYAYMFNSVSYSSIVLEGARETFILNITAPVALNSATLIYNNTAYVSTITTSGNNKIITNEITIPSVSSDTSKNFYWVLSSGTDSYNTSTYSQTIKNLTVDNCGTNTFPLFNFSLADEEMQTVFNNVDYNNSIEIDLTISSVDSSLIIVRYSNKTTINPAALCSNLNLTNSTLRIDGVIRYQTTSHVPEFYNFQNFTINNNQIANTINLYDLSSVNSTTFLIIYKDSNYVPVPDALIIIKRKYISDGGTFKTVEIPKTDINGQTTAHFDLNNVIYSILVQKNGQNLSRFDNVVVVCDNYLIGDCKLNLVPTSTSLSTDNYNFKGGVYYEVQFNISTGYLSIPFFTEDDSVITFSMNATKYDTYLNDTACTDSITSNTGTLSCTIPVIYGNTTIVVSLYKDGEFLGREIINNNYDSTSVFSNDKIFFALVFIITIPLMLSSNLIMLLVGLALSLIFSVSLFLISSHSWLGKGSAITFLIISLSIVIYKLSKREGVNK